jgi:glyoxylate utilization-related uncharacterized protein
MPLIHRLSEIELKENNSPIPHFSWKSSLPLEEISKSKYLHFDIKSLFPGKFSYPYHFHRNAEELFIILEGEATLRSPEGYQTISKGDIIFFEYLRKARRYPTIREKKASEISGQKSC